MSGIFGFINLDGRPASPDEFQKMATEMKGWGPDGVGSIISGNAAFGHAHLIVTHESPYEKMPVYDQDKGILFTAAARLDNRDELCDLFGIPHPERPVTSDGQLVLRAYKKWGSDSCKHIFGDWSFAAWHIKEQRLFLARAHLGNTGLYYYFKPPLLVFSSNVKAVLAHPEVPCELNELHLARRMIFDYSEETFFQTYWADICFLPASQTVSITSAGKQIEKFWRLDEAPAIRFKSDQDYLEGFLEQFRRAVRVRLNSIRPVGSTLSAGLDSGSVTALAAEALREQNQPLVAFTSVPLYRAENLFPGKITNEWLLAHQVAACYENIDHVPIKVEEMTILDGIKKSLNITREPQHAATNMFWIISMLENAKSRNLGVLLRGQLGNGGISWDGGANYIYYLCTRSHWRKGWQVFNAHRKKLNMPWLHAIKSQLIRPMLMPIRLKYRNLVYPHNNLLYSFPKEDFIKRMDLNKKSLILKRMDPLAERVLITSLTGTIAGTFWPFMQAYHGLDIRDPSADIHLLEYCMGVPDDQYIFGGGQRMLIRRAMKGVLPDIVRWNTLRGKQSADAVFRLIAQYNIIDKELRCLEASSQVKQYLDIDAIKNAWNAILSRKAVPKQLDAFLRSISYANFVFSISE